MTVSQAAFRAALLDPARPAPEGLQDGTGRPAIRRFDVYRNNVAVGLTEALRTAFPVVRKLVGDQFFDAMAGVHLRAHPPRVPLMMFYGADFPAFLRRFPPAAKLPYLPDVARLELAIRESYHAADALPIEAAALATVAPDRLDGLRLGLAPSLRLIRSDWPVHGIWQANMAGAAPPAMMPEDVLVTRPGFDPRLHLMPPGGGAAVSALISGAPLGIALSQEGLDAAALLGLLLNERAIIAIT